MSNAGLKTRARATPPPASSPIMDNKYETMTNAKIEDITQDEVNREILRRLRGNDPTLVALCFLHRRYRGDSENYVISEDSDTGWLGHFIGRNTHIRELEWCDHVCSEQSVRNFCSGLTGNVSLRKISFAASGRGNLFDMMTPFFAASNLESFSLRGGNIYGESSRQIAVALESCKSLKRVHLS
ncbi:hypothetical protein ACHAWF_008799 [Thalassiosira exigua]